MYLIVLGDVNWLKFLWDTGYPGLGGEEKNDVVLISTSYLIVKKIFKQKLIKGMIQKFGLFKWVKAYL